VTHPLVRIVLVAGAVSIFVFSALSLFQRYFPEFVRQPIDGWMLLLLFAVAFLPRLFNWLLDLGLAWWKKQKRRRRRKA
jgi:hypothetical protein